MPLYNTGKVIISLMRLELRYLLPTPVSSLSMLHHGSQRILNITHKYTNGHDATIDDVDGSLHSNIHQQKYVVVVLA
jgi:hypothetical protein